jgi:hypothetical protein
MSASEHPANMGKPWLDDEILQLLQNIRKKKPIKEIAEQHQRTVGSITSRLRGLAADYHAEGRPIEDIMRFSGMEDMLYITVISISQKYTNSGKTRV